MLTSDAHADDILDPSREEPAKMAVIVTYDENGGFWDHVAPPNVTGGARVRASRP